MVSGGSGGFCAGAVSANPIATSKPSATLARAMRRLLQILEQAGMKVRIINLSEDRLFSWRAVARWSYLRNEIARTLVPSLHSVPLSPGDRQTFPSKSWRSGAVAEGGRNGKYNKTGHSQAGLSSLPLLQTGTGPIV